jgi:hypothetical protein
MKKELNADMSAKIAKVIHSEKDFSLNTVGMLNGGSLLPENTKFQIIDVVTMKENGNIKPFDAVIVETSNGIQIPVSVRTFSGVYYEAVPTEKRNELKRDIENFFLKSGKNFFDFVSEHKETEFEVKESLHYNTYPYGSETMRPRNLMRYNLVEKTSKTK